MKKLILIKKLLLFLLFTTFNKYVGKSDKNQAFTPDHICDFMSKAVGVNKNSRVLDPCCGSGAFLVRAMTHAMDDCDTEEERDNVKRNQIFGIEYEEGAFGLASTNMLIHGDGNSNVVQDSMFKRGDWIQENNINIVLMNPPYNATKKCCDPEYTQNWNSTKKEDPSKGLHFVEWVARQVLFQMRDIFQTGNGWKIISNLCHIVIEFNKKSFGLYVFRVYAR